jgi:hypothetical protein
VRENASEEEDGDCLCVSACEGDCERVREEEKETTRTHEHCGRERRQKAQHSNERATTTTTTTTTAAAAAAATTSVYAVVQVMDRQEDDGAPSAQMGAEGVLKAVIRGPTRSERSRGVEVKGGCVQVEECRSYTDRELEQKSKVKTFKFSGAH